MVAYWVCLYVGDETKISTFMNQSNDSFKKDVFVQTTYQCLL